MDNIFKEKIQEIISFYEFRNDWCKRALARDYHDRIVNVDYPDACKFDLSGAILKLNHFNLIAIETIEYLNRQCGMKLTFWNDQFESKEEVINWLRSLV